MILNIKDITSAMHKISDMVSGEKETNIPGVMLNIGENEVAVCYSDGHKAFIEKLNAISEDGDIKAKLVFPYKNFADAIAKCQPSGNIKVDAIHFDVVGNVMRVWANQNLNIAQGDEVVTRKMGTKTMDIPFVLVDSTNDQKAKLLNRMNYDSIFNVESGDPDVWDRKTLINILSNTSFEKARNIYISPKTQKVFVINSAFTCAMPVKGRDITQDKQDELRGELSEAGRIADFDAELKKLTNVINRSIVISSNVAKVVASVLNRLPAPKDEEDDKIYVVGVNQQYINIFTGDDRIGIYVEQAKGSKVHIGSFDRFTGFNYSQYQMTFVREFLYDNIKSAVNSSKNEKTSFTFRDNEDGGKDLVITCQNSGASVSDTYFVTMDDLLKLDTDKDGNAVPDINTRTITVSLKPFADMLGQLKSDLVGLDISFADGDQVCMRLSEINIDKVAKEWSTARQNLGIPADAETPVEVKAGYRGNTLDTCQYSLINLTSRA